MSIRFLIFVAIVQAILWFGHAVLYVTAVSFLPVDPWPVGPLLAALSLTFVSATLLAFRYRHFFTRLYYWFAAIWLGLGHFLLIAAVTTWAVDFTLLLLGRHVPTGLLGGVMLGLGFAFGLNALVNARIIRTTQVRVKLPNLPAAWRGRTAVWISDLHLGHINRHRFARRVVRRIKKLSPDILFVGGDLFDGVESDLDSLLAPFASLQVPHGSFFVTGNHEEFTDREAFLRPVRESGMRVLDNESVTVDGVRIIGVGFMASRSADRLAGILRDHSGSSSSPAILLKHSPADFEVAEEMGIDLMISGHTHRGQLFPFAAVTRRVYHGFDYGLNRFKRLQVYTSSGTGTWGPPMRLGTQSEIVLLEFV